jgi:hypothetical protein
MTKKNDNKYVKVYKGSDFVNRRNTKPTVFHKVITFDLDETLGSFGDLYLLWNCIQKYNLFDPTEKNDFRTFYHLMDLYPEFLRYGILNMLDFLYHKKLSAECFKIYLYTNNQCSGKQNSKWVSYIVDYLSQKIYQMALPLKSEMVLFDKIICSFKINNHTIEPSRTTQNKTHSDLIRCTLLPKTAEICFIDNTYYSKMVQDRVYYIQPKSYEHHLTTDDIIDRFIMKWKLFPVPISFESNMYDWFMMNHSVKKHDLHKEQHMNIDLIVSQKLMYHLKEFFLLSTKIQKTKKISVKLGRFTRKIHKK